MSRRRGARRLVGSRRPSFAEHWKDFEYPDRSVQESNTKEGELNSADSLYQLTSNGRWNRIYIDELKPEHFLHPFTLGEPACKAFALQDLRGRAAWKDEPELKRGQQVASNGFLTTRWNWGEDKVRQFLKDLAKWGLIERQHRGGRRPSVITIMDYGLFNGEAPASAVPTPTPKAISSKTQVKKQETRTKKTDNTEERASHSESVSARIDSERIREALSREGLGMTAVRESTSLISKPTLAGVIKRLCKGEPRDGMSNELYQIEDESEAFQAFCRLIGMHLVLRDRVEDTDSENLTPLLSESDDWPEKLVSLSDKLGGQALEGVTSSEELHDRMDDLGIAGRRPSASQDKRNA